MKYTMLSIAALGLLQILLAIYVSINRLSSKISQGQPDDPDHPLHRAIVAHRNTCEFNPILCILMLQLQYSGAPTWTIWLGPLLVLARTVMAFSLIQFSPRRSHPLRAFGAGTTYAVGLALVGVTFYTLL